MSVSPERLHELFTYCMDFTKTMLSDSGDFYPFGAVISPDEQVQTVGAYDGNEHPNSQDIYRLLVDGFVEGVKNGSIKATAIAVNVNIPSAFLPQAPDGLRVHVESEGYSRFIYVPYRITEQGFFKKSNAVEFFEPFSVEASPVVFRGNSYS